ncbi:MAG TPA: hypothetical protein DEP53_17545 [Bacteroidetes bacterium]|nr:hypothetical protein [Bacteroidota bacterium]
MLMNRTVKTGVILGLLVVAWTFIMGVTGWYKDPALLNLFWLVILIQIAVMIWGLKGTSVGATYGSQVKSGTMMSVIGGVIIFCGSLLFTSIAFPHYFEELRSVGEELLKSQGKTESEVKALLDAQAPMQTSFWQALFGFIGTLVTGVIVSLIAAAFLKGKPTAETQA